MPRFLLALLLVFSSAAFAQTKAENITSIDVRELSPEMRLELMRQAQKLANPSVPSTAASASESVRSEMSKWGELGAGLGRATVAAAKEIGMAANDFAQTPLGKVTTAIVVYKIIGRDVLRMVVGVCMLLFTMVTAHFVLRRKDFDGAEWEYKPYLWGFWQRKVVVRMSRQSSEWVFLHSIGAAALTVIGIGASLSVMFG